MDETTNHGTRDTTDATQRVLVVDDELALRQITGRLLELLGREPLLACDVAEALDALSAAGRVDLVILDATLRDSEQLYGHLQGADTDGSGIPVVLASGCVSQEIQDRFPSHPERLALQKPYGLEELRAMLDSIPAA